MTDDVIEKLRMLRLKNCADHIKEVIGQAEEKNLSALQTIDRIMSLETEAREKAGVIRLFKQSRLNAKHTVDQFDFHHYSSGKRQKNVILNLMDLDFISKRQDVILIGNPGVGKTRLAKCIAYTATQNSIRTLFTTAIDMINHLIAAEADHSLLKKLHYYKSPDLPVCDGTGYLPLGRQGSNLFFQVISSRHQNKSTLITTNLPFAEWGNIFDGTTVAAAIADRLVYDSHILIMEGQSYRKKL